MNGKLYPAKEQFGLRRMRRRHGYRTARHRIVLTRMHASAGDKAKKLGGFERTSVNT